MNSNGKSASIILNKSNKKNTKLSKKSNLSKALKENIARRKNSKNN